MKNKLPLINIENWSMGKDNKKVFFNHTKKYLYETIFFRPWRTEKKYTEKTIHKIEKYWPSSNTLHQEGIKIIWNKDIFK
jgi:hypothetical protein